MVRCNFIFVTIFICLLGTSSIKADEEFATTQMQPEFKSFFNAKTSNQTSLPPKKHTTVSLVSKLKIVRLTTENQAEVKRTYQNYTIVKETKDLTYKVPKTDLQKSAKYYKTPIVLYKPYIKNDSKYYSYYFLRK